MTDNPANGATPLLSEQESTLALEPIEAGLRAAFAQTEEPAFSAKAALVKALLGRVHLASEQESLSLSTLSSSDQLPDQDDLPDRYRILGEIARGGMGAIFHGKDEELGRDVAIKVMLKTHQDNHELIQRFVEEAQIGGQLQHPGIVPVYDIGQFGDQRPYFTMKLIHGRTFADILSERTNPQQDQPRFLGVFAQVCHAIAYAHSRGVVHRDLKPANIMVGNFGDVQVMDWGLAKIKRTTDDEELRTDALRENGSQPPDRDEGLTHVGSVIGTPAYMAPEQACGTITLVDERCDVFALGAMLCQILTGSPPYTGTDRKEVQQQAQKGDLVQARQRLGKCGADPELIALTGDCLQTDRTCRTITAQSIAERTEGYLNSLDQRLRQSELEQARAGTRAEEERKRRTITRTMSVVIGLLIVGTFAGLLWFQQNRAREQAKEANRKETVGREVDLTLEQVERNYESLQTSLRTPGGTDRYLNDPSHWQGKLQSLKADIRHAQRIVKLAKLSLPTRMQTLKRWESRLKKSQTEYAFAKKLEQIRMNRSAIVHGSFDYATARKEYAKAFEDVELVTSEGREAATAKAIRKSPIREQIVAALDDWAMVAHFMKQHQLQKQLLNIARLSDEDAWRNKFRDPQVWDQPQTLWKYAQEMPVKSRTLSLCSLIGVMLKEDPTRAEQWMRKIQANHPNDFWVNFRLGNMLLHRQPKDAIGFYRAALAVRPHSSVVYLNMGIAMRHQRNPAGAIKQFEKAANLTNDDPKIYYNWSLALYNQRKFHKALSVLAKALQRDSDYALAHMQLGVTRKALGDTHGAISAYKEAIRCNPKFVDAHHNLGVALYASKDWPGAIAAFQRAVELDKTFAESYFSLGFVYHRRENLKAAVEYYRKGVLHAPNHIQGRFKLVVALCQLGDYADALPVIDRTLELMANDHPDRKMLQKIREGCEKSIAMQNQE